MRLRFVVLTCRDPRTDFRLPLVDALRHRGYEVHYVRLGRRPVVAGPSQGAPTSMSLAACLRHLRRVSSAQDAVNVYFTTTNLLFPWLILTLRALCAPGIWCFDMHDDLLYGKRGLARVRARIAQSILVPNFDLMVHAAPTLKELFPRSRHLGNASSLGRLQRVDPDLGRVLVLASVDERLDFALLEAAAGACPGVQFEVHGQVDPSVEDAMRRLLQRRTNIRHHGAYVMADLVPILERFGVMFAPYRVNVRLTRYLDPLRYYHALNSGMEVITTAIPQAEAYADRLHIVASAEDFARALEIVEKGGANGRKATRFAPITWEQRAEELLDLLAETAKGRQN
jgi:glycosyltransferase involved in cell wall biosynthesis